MRNTYVKSGRLFSVFPPVSFVGSLTLSLIVLVALFVSHPVLGQQSVTQQEVVLDLDEKVVPPKVAPKIKRGGPSGIQGINQSLGAIPRDGIPRSSVPEGGNAKTSQSKKLKSKSGQSKSGTTTIKPDVGPVQVEAKEVVLDKPAKSDSGLAQPTESERQWLDEMQAIRQRVGGGVAERLKGLNLSEESTAMNQQEFEQELMRLKPQRMSDAQDGPLDTARQIQILELQRANALRQADISREQAARFREAQPPARDQSTYNEGRRGRRQAEPREQQRAQYAAGWSEEPRRSAVRPGLASRQSDVLREAARRLEQLAAEFEESNLYDEADETRDRARHFWQKSRQLKK